MKRRGFLLIASALASLPGAVLAGEVKLGDLTIMDPWVRAALQSRPGAGYLTIRNDGTQADRLIGIETTIADHAEFHAHVMEGDVAKMVQVAAVDIPAGGVVKFEPSGLHVMFLGLNRRLGVGDSFAATLVFEHAGRVAVTFETAAAGAMGPPRH